MPPARFPFDPAERLLRQVVRPCNQSVRGRNELMKPGDPDPGQPGPSEFARYIGVDTQRIYEWRKGGVTHRSADRLATALNVNMDDLWPGINDDLDPDALPDTDVLFHQPRPSRKKAATR